MLNIGIIGHGYWGPNIVRNFSALPDARVVAVCDKNPDVLKRIAAITPAIRVADDYREITGAPDIDAVAIVTPVSTHFELAKAALENGKHVFVEKPFTDSVAHAEMLIALAESKHLIIMVDHTFLFTGAVRKIKDLIDAKALGTIYYYDSTRVNLGLFQHDVNVIWDLAPHDFAVLNHVIPDQPRALAACGRAHVNGHEDIAYVTVYFSSSLMAHINVNWLSPVKIRTTLIGGEKKMLLWNDLIEDEKLKVYDKGVDVTTKEGIYDLLVNYRSGDIWTPKIETLEALKRECSYFVDCVEQGTRPVNDGRAGLQVVRMLSACDESLRMNGKTVSL
ncbi:MAG: Gfo/Idh/MocA family oxidoreductase [Chitinispirillaceae bacterium]|jgi:predicted dehydrogenase|nr:Gfo/Idh/MocA family oxidoreductase [Chitinispirillaceae bacterium]